LHPGLVFVHPVTGFHVASVHSMLEIVAMMILAGLYLARRL